MNYDPSGAALFTPYLAATVFKSPQNSITDLACAEFSRLAYIPFETDPAAAKILEKAAQTAGFKLLGTFSTNNTQAIAVQHGVTNEVLIAFRGTQVNFDDIATDLNVLPSAWVSGGNVHTGFQNAFHDIWTVLKAQLGNALCDATFTGHSLGGALAHLAASTVHASKPKLVTFGSPAVGDKIFTKTLSKTLHRRYVNCCDLVTKLPPEFMGYQHTDGGIYIDRDGKLATYLSDSNQATYDRTLGRLEFAKNYTFSFYAIKIRDLTDHSPINYIRVFY